MQILRFHAGEFELAAPASVISDVAGASDDAPHICGLLDLPSATAAVRTLTLSTNGVSWRLSVDAPLRFSELSSQAIVPASETLRRRILPSYVLGFARLDNQLITLVSASAIAERIRQAADTKTYRKEHDA